MNATEGEAGADRDAADGKMPDPAEQKPADKKADKNLDTGGMTQTLGGMSQTLYGMNQRQDTQQLPRTIRQGQVQDADGQTQSQGGQTQTQGANRPQPQKYERRAAIQHAMLSRTADNLFWLARYMERADYLARVIEASQRLSALPSAYGGAGTEWESALASAGAVEAFFANHTEADEAQVVEFLAFSTVNPSSIHNCIQLARTNARSVRTALTIEMWEAINSAWLELKRSEREIIGDQIGRAEKLARFLEFVKDISLRFAGAVSRTMLRNDAYWFSRLGLYIERADNTARILDVKYHVLLPETESVGGQLDYFQWTAILRAVSGLTAYHWVYRESIKPWLIADLLILRAELPLSLRACYSNIVQLLDAIARAYGRQGHAQRHARTALARLENASIDDIFQTGLHEYITTFVGENARLAQVIAEQYLA